MTLRNNEKRAEAAPEVNLLVSDRLWAAGATDEQVYRSSGNHDTASRELPLEVRLVHG